MIWKKFAEKIVKGFDLLKFNNLATIAMIVNQLFQMIFRINLISILGHWIAQPHKYLN